MDGTEESEDYRDAKVQLLTVRLKRAQAQFDEKEAVAKQYREEWEGHAKTASEALELYRDWRDNGDPDKKAATSQAEVHRRTREEALLVELDSLRKQIELANSRLADVTEIEKEILQRATTARKGHDKMTKERETELNAVMPIARKKADADRKALGDAMWSVALADGDRDDAEEVQLQAIETALGLTDADIAAARETALKGL